MKVDKDIVVSLTYTLKNGGSGEVIEVCDASKPLEFVYDSGSMLPHFEKNIEGLEAGSEYDFTLTADQAYGIVNESAIVEVSKDIFVVDGQLREDLLEIGKSIPMRDNSGNPLNGKVTEIKESVVVIDFNHPLAGQTLHFTGKIEATREATAEELAYGIGGSASGGCGSGGCGSGCGCGPEGEESYAESDNCSTGGCGSGCGCG